MQMLLSMSASTSSLRDQYYSVRKVHGQTVIPGFCVRYLLTYRGDLETSLDGAEEPRLALLHPL